MAGIIANMNTHALKEPLGFIRILELPLAILAFATTAGYYATTTVTIAAPACAVESKSYPFVWGYPFDLRSVEVPNNICPGGQVIHGVSPFGMGAQSQAQFFVFNGVISFLYILVILAVYLFAWPAYENDKRFAFGDLVVTAILALFWFIASCAWASGVSIVKSAAYPSTIENRLKEAVIPCNGTAVTPAPNTTTPAPTNICTVGHDWNYASLNVSLIAGFACFAVWAANLWFIYKETAFYKARHAPPPTGTMAGGVPGTAAGAGRSGIPGGGPFR